MSSLRARLILGSLAGTSLFLLLAGFTVYALIRARMLDDLEQSLTVVWQSTALTLQRERVAEGEGGAFLHASYPLVGVSFAPWGEGQDPDLGARVEETQLRERLELLAGDAAAIRTFTIDAGLDAAGRIVQELGGTAVVGAWIGPDRTTNARELERLVELAHAGEVDVAVVGTDVLERGDLPEAELIVLLRETRARLPEHVPITTSADWEVWFEKAALVGVVDLLLASYRPFSEGVDVADALQTTSCWHEALLELAQDRPVVAEVGWPTDGETLGAAVPSPENAAHFLAEFRVWAARNEVPYLWNAAFDEPWKTRLEPAHAPHWGYRSSAGARKPALAAVLAEPEDGSAAASLVIESIPARGSDELLSGSVSGVGFLTHGVVACILVDGVWWPKPEFEEPVTEIDCHGNWEVDLENVATDDRATRFAVFVVPRRAELPHVGGATTLPQELHALAVASVEMNR